MAKNKVLFGKEAFSLLKKGMDVVYEAVAGTIGAAGRNVIYRQYGVPIITNDGVSIADRINLEDETESIGADYIKQPAKRTNEEAGDGTSTAIVLAHALVTEGMKKINAGVNPMALRRQMIDSVREVVKELKSVSHSIKSPEELLSIANISVENREIAEIVRDAVANVGEDGVVIVDESTGTRIESEFVKGLKFDKGYISPYMVTNPEKMESVLTNAKIVVTDRHFNLNNDMFGLLSKALGEGIKDMLIIAEDISGELLATIITNKLKGVMNIVCVRKPYYAETLEDIAILTGAESLTQEKGVQILSEHHVASLGFASKVIVTKDSCLIVGGGGSKEKIEDRIKSIKGELSKAENYEKQKLKDRLARIVGGVAVIKVGAPTEGDMKYLRAKIEDAVNATKAAMEEGIVVGGGRTLYDISKVKPKDDGDEVVRKACGYPINRIIANSGENPAEVIAQLKKGEVYNTLTNSICEDPIGEGIVDPLKVERCALINAVSFAGTFLTHHAVIVEIPEATKEKFMPE